LTSFGLREIDSFLFSSGGGSDGGGGGQPLQTLVMLEEDRLTDDLARALCRYWCAEGVAQHQVVLMGSLLPGVERSLQLLDDYSGGARGGIGRANYEGSTPEELRDFIFSLPKNLHLEKFRSRATRQSTTPSANSANHDGNLTSNNRESISAIIEEDEEENDDGDDDSNGAQSKDEGLINAWQYRKSIQDARSGIEKNGSSADVGQSSGGTSDGVYCHSYDLSKRMWDQFASADGNSDNLEANHNPLVMNTKVIDCSESTSSSMAALSKNGVAMECQSQGMDLFCTLWKHLQSALSTHPNRVIRLFLHRLPIGIGAVSMPLLMSKIRKENLPVVVLTTIRPWKWISSAPTSSYGNNINKLDTLASLRSSTDTTLSLDSFSSLRTPPPPEFSLLQGILTVRKCASFTTSHYTDTVTWKRPLAERFGVKRDGRKVTVQLLHLPPEEYSKGGSSTGGGVRSGGGQTVVVDGHDKEHHGSGSSRAVGGGCSSLNAGSGGGSLDF